MSSVLEEDEEGIEKLALVNTPQGRESAQLQEADEPTAAENEAIVEVCVFKGPEGLYG
jgi:hypothetical protein